MLQPSVMVPLNECLRKGGKFNLLILDLVL